MTVASSCRPRRCHSRRRHVRLPGRVLVRARGGLRRLRPGLQPVFAVNSAGLVASSQLGGRLVTRVGSAALLRFGLIALVVGAIGTLIVTLAHFRPGAAPDLAVRDPLPSIGFVFPNATAVALAEQEGALGSASALLGVGQFGTGAVVAPLVGLAGPRDAVPMGVVIGVCGTAALAVNLVFSRPPPGPRPDGGDHVAARGRRGRARGSRAAPPRSCRSPPRPIASSTPRVLVNWMSR